MGSDHGGFEQKNIIKNWLRSKKNKENQDCQLELEDVGAYKLDPYDDYPKFAFAVAKKVVDYQKQVTQPDAVGILICRSAGGVTVAANKVDGARAVLVSDEKSAVHAKEHNNANIIAISGDWTSTRQAKEIIKIFLSTEYKKLPRHERRIAQINDFEQKTS